MKKTPFANSISIVYYSVMDVSLSPILWVNDGTV